MLEEMMNNVLDYYRGSGLYEVAVQNQLNYLDGNETKQAINQLEESISENTDVANGIRRDIKAAAAQHYTKIQLPEKPVITYLAKDTAFELGIELL